MKLFVLTAGHHQVQLETIAQLSAAASALPSTVICLATCNRFEVYGVTDHDAPHSTTLSTDNEQLNVEELLSIIASASDMPLAQVRSTMTLLEEDQVPEHLFRVASGLDSAVVGEREISGQVRRALETAQNATPSPSGILVQLFQAASRVARQVGAHTELGGHGRSISSVGIDLAIESLPQPLEETKTLLIGTGAYAGISLALLRERGMHNPTVYSHSGRATEFVASRGGTPADSLAKALGRAELVISCSGSETERISEETFSQARRQAHRENSPVTIVDLALGHDFEESLGKLPGVHLVTLADIHQTIPEAHAEVLTTAERILAQAVSDFHQSRQLKSVDSAIVALRQHTLATLDEELDRVRRQHGCTAAAEEVEFALRRMVKQLLHAPSQRGRELAAAGREAEYLAAVELIYGLGDDSAKNQPTPAPEAMAHQERVNGYTSA